jgi:hypothetical protein
MGPAGECVEQAAGLHARRAKHRVDAMAQQALNDRVSTGHARHGCSAGVGLEGTLASRGCGGSWVGDELALLTSRARPDESDQQHPQHNRHHGQTDHDQDLIGGERQVVVDDQLPHWLDVGSEANSAIASSEHRGGSLNGADART